MAEKKSNRKQDILQNLALMLENDLGDRITTARLAKEVGVSEAALYRHFPSKARMYESLLDFCEESLFSRINTIAGENQTTDKKCFMVSSLVLSFCQRNAGISRLLTGEVLLGETDRLKARVSQIFDKLELSLKQIIRNAAINSGESAVDAGETAKLLSSVIEGRVQQFVRSSFKIDPMENWESQWRILGAGVKLSG
ncbi:nucleoid occlusion factor SlmA [Aliikangiella sp. G2MR2-5]|uniref:nucleoid occlusion factor SlmA n=1 Tax=Aliikangiella sp. G2MR2-5 TaxID=2788943 RepID=UPI0018AB3000